MLRQLVKIFHLHYQSTSKNWDNSKSYFCILLIAICMQGLCNNILQNLTQILKSLKYIITCPVLRPTKSNNYKDKH